MRKGKNTSKNKLVEIAPSGHRVIIPLYIPNLEGYYQNTYDIFLMTLDSILKTSQSIIKITVVSNGCCAEVNKNLAIVRDKKIIDELFIVNEEIGKINSILKALRSVEERLITITDADVLFLPHWEEKVIEIFENFPKAGMVSPVPIFRTDFRHTSNIWIRYLFSKKLTYKEVKNPDALTSFANSLGWSYLSDKLKDVILTIKGTNDVCAVVGNSHFVGTYKREVFKNLPQVSSKYKLGGDSERNYLDIPVLKAGGYRLATYDNYAYHMGNAVDEWILQESNKLVEVDKKEHMYSHLPELKGSRLHYIIASKLFAKLFHLRKFKIICFRIKGLSKEKINDFLSSNYE